MQMRVRHGFPAGSVFVVQHAGREEEFTTAETAAAVYLEIERDGGRPQLWAKEPRSVAGLCWVYSLTVDVNGEGTVFLHFHYTYHVGQLEVLRQLAGKTDKLI